MWFIFLMVQRKMRTTKKLDEKTQNGQDFVYQEHLILNLPLKWFICAQKKTTNNKNNPKLKSSTCRRVMTGFIFKQERSFKVSFQDFVMKLHQLLSFED